MAKMILRILSKNYLSKSERTISERFFCRPIKSAHFPRANQRVQIKCLINFLIFSTNRFSSQKRDKLLFTKIHPHNSRVLKHNSFIRQSFFRNFTSDISMWKFFEMGQDWIINAARRSIAEDITKLRQKINGKEFISKLFYLNFNRPLIFIIIGFDGSQKELCAGFIELIDNLFNGPKDTFSCEKQQMIKLLKGKLIK